MSLLKLADFASPDVGPAQIAVGGLSVGVLVGNFLGFWPYYAGGVASLFVILYYALTILHMPVVQIYLQTRKEAKRVRILARLEARQKVDAARIAALQTVKRAQVDATAIVEKAKVEAENTVAASAAKSKP